MIEIYITKDKSENFIKIKSLGHASLDDNSKYSLVCNSVSVLLQTIYLNLRIMSNVSHETISKGNLEFQVSQPDERSNFLILSILAGLENLTIDRNELSINYIRS